MKKQTFILFFLLGILGDIYAQNYVLEYDVEFFLYSGRRRFYCNLHYTTSQNSTPKNIPAFRMHQERRDHFSITGQTLISAKDGPVDRIWAETSRQVKSGPFWSGDGSNTAEHYSASNGRTEFTLTDLWWGSLSTHKSRVVTHVFRVYPQLLFTNVQPTLLPSRDKVLISNTSGFPRAVYRWQYSIDGAGTWLDVPASVIDASPSGSLKVCGTDLMSETAFQELASQGKPVLFRIFNSVKSSKTVSLQPALSSPRVSFHEIFLEKCHQSADAVIKVTLNRPLLSGEALSCFINGQSVGSAGNISLDGDNSFLLEGYSSGSYHISFKGSYHGYSTYTDDAEHKFTALIPERPAITHSFTQKDVSCFSGDDGVITLTAAGGTGTFTAELTDANGAVVQKQVFDAGNTRFAKLPRGIYTLRVRDSNGCVAKRASGEELIHHITLTEPSEAVFIKEISKTSPLAHQSEDGSIQIAVSGGSPSASGYKVRFIRTSDGQSFAPTDSRPDGTQYIYTLGNIPRGEYTAIAEDMRYDWLEDEDRQEPCGCLAKLAITLSAPPPLIVEMEETHFVRCHGENTGALTAHAKGGKPITTAQLPYTYRWFKIKDGIREELSLQRDSIARNLVAGQYQVQVTDDNGISAQSVVFDLGQPDELSLTFMAHPPSCSGGSGLITATVTGGTAPYAYEWNKEGASEAQLMIDEAGIYFVRVVDSRGCSITGQVEVGMPDALSIKPTITHPSCHDANNGSISLELSGGTAPYTIHWKDDNHVTTAHRENLKAGEYVAVITDQAGCSLPYRVVLEQPEAPFVKLGDGFTLCQGQSRKIVAQSSFQDATYQWFHDGQLLKEAKKDLMVDKAGSYRVVTTNESGCTAMAEVDIKTSDTELPLDITAPTSVTVGAPIHAVNISRIRADKLEWRLPVHAIVVHQSDERIIFTIPEAGYYEITLVGHLGDCSAAISQRLQVVEQGHVELPDGTEAIIKQFLVTPNPTTGAFKVYVELTEPSNFTLRLLSPSGTEMDRKAIQHTTKQTFEYELRGDIDGTFGVELVVGNEKSTLRITKKKP